MHKIKQAARRDDASIAYNAFGRLDPRPRYRPRIGADVENQNHVRHIHSDPAYSSSSFDGGDVGLQRSHTDPLPALTLKKNEKWYDATTKDDPKEKGTLNGDDRQDADDRTHHVDISDTVEALKLPKRKRVFFNLPVTKNSEDESTGDDDENERRAKSRIPLMSQFKSIFGVWSSLLLAFIPIGFALYYTHQPPVAVFIVNFFAIIPSSAIIGFVIEEITTHAGHVLGGLLSMTFSNSVQLISSIFLLKSRQIAVLRASLLGGILQSLLVMTGLSFFLGGVNRDEQFFNARIAQMISMLLLLAMLSLTVPTVSQLWGHTSAAGILAQSRGTSVVIIFSYGLWLVFALKTNLGLFSEEIQRAPKRSEGKKEEDETMKGIAVIGAASGAAIAGGRINWKDLVPEKEDEEEIRSLTKTTAVGTLVDFTALLAFNVEFATNSIQGMIAQHNISSTFVGIVILPILSNELLPIECAMNDRMDRSIAFTLERCMQSALMVIPLVVLIAWGIGIDDMTLDFDGFSVAAAFASVIIVSYVVQEGNSNWLAGALLLKVFVIIGLASFYVE